MTVRARASSAVGPVAGGGQKARRGRAEISFEP